MTREFVKFPEMWRMRLGEIGANGTTFMVALYLLDKARWSREVTLGNGALRQWGVERRAKWRALEQLCQAGLIAVERRPRKSPVVTVRWTA